MPGILEAEARAAERKNLKIARVAVEMAKPRKAPRKP
jgi:hypothetical protein